MNHELVTVIITTYKRSDMLETAIESNVSEFGKIVVDEKNVERVCKSNCHQR